MEIKTKSDAKLVFTSFKAMAEALGINPSALSQWPEDLTERQVNEITGAAIRKGLIDPCDAVQHSQ